MIHTTDDGMFVISSNRVWMPGADPCRPMRCTLDVLAFSGA